MPSNRSLQEAVEIMYQRSVHDQETDCWLWEGSKNWKGYGQGYCEGKAARIHRLSYRHFFCDPGDFHVLHKCDRPNCWNPDHLWLGTNKDNADDRDAKDRTSKGQTHGPAILTEEQVLSIRASQLSHAELGTLYGVHRVTIIHIKQRKTWRHI